MGFTLLWAAIGAAVGSAVGVGVGLWFARRRESAVPVAPPPPAEEGNAVQANATAADETTAATTDAPTAATDPEPTASANDAPTPPQEEPAPTTLAGHLQGLRPRLDELVEATGHPHLLLGEPPFSQAIDLLRDPAVERETLMQYALGTNTGLSCAALEAVVLRGEAEPARTRILGSFASLGTWQLYFALRAVHACRPRRPIGEVLVHAPDWWPSRTFAVKFVGEYLSEAHAAGAAADFGETLEGRTPADAARIETLLALIEEPVARALQQVLADWRATLIDRAALTQFGQFLAEPAREDMLIELDAWAEPITLCEATLIGTPPRSVLLVGEPRSGKSSLLRLLAGRLVRNGYSVFVAGGTEILAGQKYIGEVEERVQMLLRELAAGKRVVWYVPDLMQLAIAGTHRNQPTSVLEMVMPAMAAGKLVLASEAGPSQFTRLLQALPALRGILQMVRLRPLGAAEIEAASLAYARCLQDTLTVAIEPDVAQAALHLARQYLGAQQGIGTVFDFMKVACTRVLATDQDVLTRDGLLETLSQATGLPRAILDDGERIELATIRAFFTQRVIGQQAAVDTIVDRIAMLKAGLTDPGRPIGVFLFAGPTGTGKTELAKTLAEYLFGAADRMIRLDMSEFQTADSTRKIIGEGDGESESLTQKVRKQPFCVVLLDEFEKAHPNAWDLFLQVFDDGRLTDASGHTVDFRHAIVILTTNLGATAHKGGEMGFVSNTSAFNDAQVLRAVQQSFRPEFVNRLDRVIVFQPLGRDRMHEILLKELRRVLERRGLKEREWAVEMESSALQFLLDKGFTHDMGARPLRRAIDQYLLAPLAATLVEHRFPRGEQFLFVRSDGQGIQVEFVDPDADEPAPVAGAGSDAPAEEFGASSLGTVILRPAGQAGEAALLRARLDETRRAIEAPELEAARETLSAAMREAGFWDRDDRFVQLARYALHDRVRTAIETANALDERLRRSVRGGAYSKALAGRLAQQLYLVELGLADARDGNVSDAVLQVLPALDGNADRAETDAWCRRIFAMYRGWATRRHMQLHEFTVGERPTLVIGGFGAWRVLAAEAGLHVLEHEGTPMGRRTARVVVAQELPAHPGVKTRREQQLAVCLETAPAVNEVVRRYREKPAPLVRDARDGWRTGRLDLVLAGDFDLMAAR